MLLLNVIIAHKEISYNNKTVQSSQGHRWKSSYSIHSMGLTPIESKQVLFWQHFFPVLSQEGPWENVGEEKMSKVLNNHCIVITLLAWNIPLVWDGHRKGKLGWNTWSLQSKSLIHCKRKEGRKQQGNVRCLGTCPPPFFFWLLEN